MSRFVWTPQLEVGFADMDAQHQALIALMARLDDEIAGDAGRAECLATLDELGELSVRHFADEEAVMASVRFPRMDHHQLLHQLLLERFGDHVARVKSPDGRMTPAFIEFLNTWLNRHIKGPDTQYGVYAGQLTSRAG